MKIKKKKTEKEGLMLTAKGLSSERIAQRLLKSIGFHIIYTNYPVLYGDKKVAEIDIIAEDSHGERYAVEVKAGKGEINSLFFVQLGTKIYYSHKKNKIIK